MAVSSVTSVVNPARRLYREEPPWGSLSCLRLDVRLARPRPRTIRLRHRPAGLRPRPVTVLGDGLAELLHEGARVRPPADHDAESTTRLAVATARRRERLVADAGDTQQFDPFAQGTDRLEVLVGLVDEITHIRVAA